MWWGLPPGGGTISTNTRARWPCPQPGPGLWSWVSVVGRAGGLPDSHARWSLPRSSERR